MSLRKGDRVKRGQKHQNSTAFKAGLHCQSGKKARDAASVVLAGLCARCREKIEWKIKYDKYKPLTVPKKCILCQGKAVKQVYHQVCRQCSETRNVCAKCGKREDIVERFPPTIQEVATDETQFRAGLKKMTERERRTFLRENFGDRASMQSKATVTATINKADDVPQDTQSDSEEARTCSEINENGTLSPVVANSSRSSSCMSVTDVAEERTTRD